ncbi:hypothetical protein [Bacteroides neonati]|uniref:hypothetical protein n=1 Tax=Bacteroides neonati TaxID=1347393 RepID=UPI0004AFC6D1|nr:hypothetical protein [Bacteroides neonati]
MNMLVEKTNINQLLERAQELIDWLSDHPLADIRVFEDKANQLAILSIKINNYYHNNKSYG